MTDDNSTTPTTGAQEAVTLAVESGVSFTQHAGTKVQVEATFLESGNQMQMAIIGTEPVLLVQPNFDADDNEVTFILTSVDLGPEGLVEVLEILLDAARTMAEEGGRVGEQQLVEGVQAVSPSE